jgi:hypothetical protein
VHTLLEVAVYKCSRGGMACSWNLSEAGHVLAELGYEMLTVYKLSYAGLL